MMEMETQNDTAQEKDVSEAEKENKVPSEGEKPAKKFKKEKKDSDKSEMVALMAENEALKAKLAEMTDTYQRMLAEYANYKRRSEQEKEQLGLFTKCDILAALLPTLDGFDRAAAAGAGDEYKTGMEMIVAGFAKTLSELGLTEIPAQDEPFNPELHHAVMREDAPDIEVDTVTEVFQKGYTIGGRVIRPAMVKVAN